MTYKNDIFLEGEDIDITSGDNKKYPSVGDGSTYGKEREYEYEPSEAGYEENTYYEDSDNIEDHSEPFAIKDRPDESIINSFFSNAISSNPFESDILRENKIFESREDSKTYNNQLPSEASVHAADFVISVCRDDSHGYNLFTGSRTGNPDYCSSTLISKAYRSVGVPLMLNSYTDKMYKDCLSHGFKDVSRQVNLHTGEGTIKGDILLNPGNHAEMVVTRNGHRLGGARHDENGGKGGLSGDQTGTEVSVREWWDADWKYCLRYVGDVKLNPPQNKLQSNKKQIALGAEKKDGGKLAQKTGKTTKSTQNVQTASKAYQNNTTMATQTFLNSLSKINSTITSDYNNGKFWRFTNDSNKLQETFSDAVNNNKRYLNTTTLYQWALRESGITTGNEGNFGFKQGLFFGSSDAKAFFDISSGNGKTQNECVKQGLLKPGDIACIQNSNHVVVYAGNNDFYDGSTKYCDGTGEGAKYKKVLGNQTSNKISGIARLKDSVTTDNDDGSGGGGSGGSGGDGEDFSDSDSNNMSDSGMEESGTGFQTNIIITYGWVGHRGNILQARTIEGQFTKYSIEFQGASSVLTVEGTVQMNEHGGRQHTLGYSEYPADEYHGIASDIVKAVCAEEDIKMGTIEDTKPILDSLGQPKSFTRSNETALTFIQSQLCEDAVSLDGKVGFVCYIDSDGKLNYVHMANSSGQKSKFLANSSSSNNQINNTQIIDPLDQNQEAVSADPLDLNNVQIFGASSLGESKTAGTVMIGDSRTVGMYNAVNGGSAGNSIHAMDSRNTYWSAQTGATITQMKSLWNDAKGYIGEGTEVAILMGVNDLQNASGYKNYIEKTIKPYVEKKGGSVTFVSVNPVDDSKTAYAKNSAIEDFNDTMKDADVNYLDTYSQLKNKVKGKTDGEGIHYNSSLYNEIYNAIKKGTAGSGDSDDSDSSEDGSSADASSTQDHGWEIVRYYEYYCGRVDSRVINFAPEVMDYSIAEILPDTASVDDLRNQVVELIDVSNPGVENDGRYIAMGRSSAAMQSLVNSSIALRTARANGMNKATLEIMGDCDIEFEYPNSCIYITVYTKYGFFHHTSGLYCIKEIEDNIADGLYTTTLTLDNSTQAGTGGSGFDNSGTGASNEDDEDNTGRDSLSSTGGSTGNQVIDDALSWARKMAKENKDKGNHSYSQSVRWGPTYDCSSFAISCYKTGAGLSIDTQVVNYTGNMTGLLNYGFKDVTSSCDFGSCKGMQPGDIIWWDGGGTRGHAAVYIGNNKIIHSTNGNGISGIQESNYYRGSFAHVYRYSGSNKKKKK